MSYVDCLAIVGSQHWDNELSSVQAKICIASAITFIEPRLLISGGCPEGVDRWVEDEWMERSYYKSDTPEIWCPDFEEFLPEVKQWDPPVGKGYMARNLEIAGRCDALISIRSRSSQTFGSGWTANEAEKLGKKVWRFLF